MSKKVVAGITCGIAALVLLSGCGGSAAAGSASAGSASAGSGAKLRIVASFYPLQYVTARIAGDHAVVASLTPPGAEPHDLELSAKDVTRVSDADLVVYLGGFQAAVDAAVTTEAKNHADDVRAAADLNRSLTEQDAGAEPETGTDPHFWLDPQRLSAVSAQIEQRLATLDPIAAGTFRTNLAGLQSDLAQLDQEYRTGLATCENKNLVTSHQAFGYLSQRYGMTQVGITGLTPEQEPDPATLARVADFVRKNKVRTIYYETLLSPAIANTVASETGVRTDVLDPIEGITPHSQGRDYLAIMHSNLRNLQKGQPCP